MGRASLAAAALAGTLAAGAAAAQDPPVPDFYWPYGRVQADGGNLAPEAQPVVGIIRGQACGVGMTLVAPPWPDTPDEDEGKTVYVVNIYADGTSAGQRPGCGRAGDLVQFYFPVVRRLAVQQPLFHPGEERLNLELGPALSARLLLPFVTDDGPLQ
jgi:hypothetical protein